MTIEHFTYGLDPHLASIFPDPESRTVASYERELTEHRSTETRLRRTLAREEALLRHKDELIQQQAILSQESDHRLLNGLQMIVSLLSLQSRAAVSVEAASQLASAANRIATIGRIHRRLHSFDGVQTVAFKRFLEDLCGEFSQMLLAEERAAPGFVVEAVEVGLPAVTAIPLGFIVNELITNATKHGKGPITVRLEPNPGKGYALSVSHDGPVLAEGFDPGGCQGLGMKIIRSLVAGIGGRLQIGRGDQNQGVRFTVLFA